MKQYSSEELLQQYVATQSDAAFSELVRRFTSKVHSIAANMVDWDTARDVSQRVFITLARKAGNLESPVEDWLARTTFNFALHMSRGSRRRDHREQQTATMNSRLANGEEPNWDLIRPHIEHAIEQLSDEDRRIIRLRYYVGDSASVAAEKLGITEDAAQRRATRALGRVREYLARHGISTSTSGLAALLAANAVQAAPAGLAAAISSAVAFSTSSAAVTPFTQILTMTAFQKGLVALTALSVAGVVGLGIYAKRQVSLRDQAEAAVPALQEQMEQLRYDRDDATNQLASQKKLAQQFQARFVGESRLQEKNARLEADLAALKQHYATNTSASRAWDMRADALQAQAKDAPEMQIPEMQFVSYTNWLAATQVPLETDEARLNAYSAVRGMVEGKAARHIHRAVRRHMAASGGQFPTHIEHLLPYFDPPWDPAMLVRWQVVTVKDDDFETTRSGRIIRLTPVDPNRDLHWAVDENGPRSARVTAAPVSSLDGEK